MVHSLEKGHEDYEWHGSTTDLEKLKGVDKYA